MVAMEISSVPTTTQEKRRNEMKINAIDHIQLAMPPNQEQKAREFYAVVLGLAEKPKPDNLAKRGGVWFEQGSLKIHLGVEQDFKPSAKAHPGLLVEGLSELVGRCERAGYSVVGDSRLDGYHRAFVTDPFGNRIELMEPIIVEKNKQDPAREFAWSQLLKSAAERAIRYRESLAERRVAPLPETVTRVAELGGPLPEQPTEAESILALLDEIGSPATVTMAGGRYFGFVNGSSLPATLAANWLAGAWDQNAGLSIQSPIAIALEEIALGWLLDVLDLPAESGGAFVTGATMANFTCLAAARNFVLKNAGWDVEARGLFGAPEINVVVGEEVHPTLLKALGLLGLGRARILTVPADEQGRMRANAFPELAAPAIVCIQAGNVNTGAFDPAPEICALARRAGAWIHVDGAFGLWAAASPDRSALVNGFADADSWATDAHKWLNVPYDSGLAFVRYPKALSNAMSLSAAYLPTGSSREPMHYNPEASRRARGVEVWAALRSLGRAGLAELIERTCRHARRFAEGFREAGYVVLNDVVVNQVLVYFGDEETTRRVISGVQEDGTCWCGGTVWQGKSAMRISVSSWATTEEDVERSLAAMLRVAGRETGK
jgi:glutamate/tyrosine decarboxylase-like PLP-dependent enzyme/catechol 2,3-dioxygenase-like lactoylglutathione lyase family enzyme